MSNDKRRIQTGTALMQPFSHDAVGADPLAWLHTKAKAEMLLLAHADDGIIWGKVATGVVDAVAFTFPPEKLWRQPKLHVTTLLMARLFDEQREYFLWRVDEGKWQARLLQDDAGEACEFYDELQILWGTLATPQVDGFVKMTEGAQGMHHAPPSIY